jgi:hypothetical protein
MSGNFAGRLAALQRKRGTTLALLLRPRVAQLPLPIQKYDDPFLPFGKAIISATQPHVCAYVFDLAAYLALGAAGAVALERTIAYARANHDTLTILHGPFASPDYADAAGSGGFGVDAVTVTSDELLEAYTSQGLSAFAVRAGQSPIIIPMPGDAGVFWPEAGLFTLLSPSDHHLQMRLAGERVLYAGRGDDFAERVGQALAEMGA